MYGNLMWCFITYVGIVRVGQIFGHGYDFPTWSELGTKSKVKPPNFNGKKYLEEFKKYL